MRNFWRAFWFPVLVTVGIIGYAATQSTTLLISVLILGVVEVLLSFDNAIVNAKILARMSPFWRRIFLTVGIFVAVFVVRFIFPILLVMSTAHLGFMETIDLAFNQPELYEIELHAAHPAIVGVGGTFLLMLFLDWVFEERDTTWLGPLERWLARLGQHDVFASVVGITVLFVTSMWFSHGHTEQMLVAGVFGWILYQIIQLLDKITEHKAEDESVGNVAKRSGPGGIKLATGGAGFVLFMKLEVIDASFSFDGVAGAFAITTNVIAIMLGLGLGAIWVRGLTVFATDTGALKTYAYLEHGAFWAMGALSTIMFVSVYTEIPEWITGVVSMSIIGSAIVGSLIYKKRHPEFSGVESIFDDEEDDDREVAARQ